MKKTKDSSKGLTPNKQKRRSGGGDPSPSRVLFKLSPGSNKKTDYRHQGR